MVQTLHHDTTGPKSAVADLACWVHHILSSGGSESNIVWNVFDNKQWMSVQSSDIFAAVIVAAKPLNLQSHRIDPDLIGSQSLRSGGAMTLKLMGFSDSTIKNTGKRTSHTWEMYI